MVIAFSHAVVDLNRRRTASSALQARASGKHPRYPRLLFHLGRSVEDPSGLIEFLSSWAVSCSILLGSVMGMRRVGSYRLGIVDGHGHQTPDTSGTGGGRHRSGPGRPGGDRRPHRVGRGKAAIPPEHVVAAGFRDAGRPSTAPRTSSGRGIGWIDEAEVRSLGPGAVAHVASERLDGQGLEGFWVHVDVDVLSTAEMPAVDSRSPVA